jgi:hypothetical protein
MQQSTSGNRSEDHRSSCIVSYCSAAAAAGIWDIAAPCWRRGWRLRWLRARRGGGAVAMRHAAPLLLSAVSSYVCPLCPVYLSLFSRAGGGPPLPRLRRLVLGCAQPEKATAMWLPGSHGAGGAREARPPAAGPGARSKRRPPASGKARAGGRQTPRNTQHTPLDERRETHAVSLCL